MINLEELNSKIKKTQAVMLYFSGENCGVCKVLKPKIQEAFLKHYPKIEQIEIPVEQNPKIAGQFNIFSLPTIIVYFDGKEFNKKVRNLSVEAFIDEIKRPYSLYFN